MSRANPKSSGKAIAKAQRKEEALRLRVQGARIVDIAERLKVDGATVYRYIIEGLQDLAKNTALSAEEWRQIEVERLDNLDRMAMTLPPGKERIDSHLRIHAARVKLLDLCAPVRHIHTDGVDEMLLKNAPEGVALDRLRLARAEMAELELAQKREKVVSVEDIREKFNLMLRHLGKAQDELRRRGFDEALDIVNGALDAVVRDAQKHLPISK